MTNEKIITYFNVFPLRMESSTSTMWLYLASFYFNVFMIEILHDILKMFVINLEKGWLYMFSYSIIIF